MSTNKMLFIEINQLPNCFMLGYAEDITATLMFILKL